MMNSVSSQIQRAINDAIYNQVLPQIQNVIMAGSGQETRRGWERSDERPESYSEVQHNVKAKTTLNSEHGDKKNHRNVHDRYCSDFSSLRAANIIALNGKLFLKTLNRIFDIFDIFPSFKYSTLIYRPFQKVRETRYQSQYVAACRIVVSVANFLKRSIVRCSSAARM